MTSVKQLTLKAGIILLYLSLQHYSVNSHPVMSDTCSECIKVDEKELVDIYNSRYHGADFYSSSCLYLLHYMIPLADSTSNSTSVMPRYVGLVSSEGRCSKAIHDPECLNVSHPQYKNNSFCDWNYSLKYLGENHFPRYIVELECNTSNVDSCRVSENNIIIKVLKRLDGCTEEGFERWSNSDIDEHVVTAGCSCQHVPYS